MARNPKGERKNDRLNYTKRLNVKPGVDNRNRIW